MTNSDTEYELTEVDFNRVYPDGKGGIFFWKYFSQFTLNRATGKWNKSELKPREAITPEQCEFYNGMSSTIYIVKKIDREDSLESEEVVFSQELKYNMPNERAYAFSRFFKCKDGTIMIRNFESGCTYAVGVNDPIFVTRSKAKRLPSDTLLSVKAPMYRMGIGGELERYLPVQEGPV